MIDKLDIGIHLDVNKKGFYYLGESVTGLMLVACTEDLPIKVLGYELIYEVRGKFENNNRVIKMQVVFKNEILKAGKEYEFPIEFTNDQYESYNGVNVSFLFRINPFVVFEENESAKSFFSEIVHWFKGNKNNTAVYLKFKSKESKYQILYTTSELKMRMYDYLKYGGVFLVLLGVLAMAGFTIDMKLLVTILALAFILGTFYYNLGKLILIKNLQAIIKDKNQDSFEVTIKENNSFNNINKLDIEYAIVEKVIDDRGTSSVTYEEVIYRSDSQEFMNPMNDITTSFKYSKDMHGTTDKKNIRIYWQIELEVYSIMGIKFSYHDEFLVKKELL